MFLWSAPVLPKCCQHLNPSPLDKASRGDGTSTFTGIYIAVHLEAKKLGLKGIPRDQLPRIRQLLPKIYLLAPLVLLVVMVSTNIDVYKRQASTWCAPRS